MDIRYKYSLQPMEGPHHTQRLRPRSLDTSSRKPLLEEHDRTLTPKRPQLHSWNQGYEHVHIHNVLKPKLQTFDGKREPFLMQLRLMSKSYNWSDRKFREQLIFALRGKALIFTSNLPQRTTENTACILRSMGQQYSARVSHLMLRAYSGIQSTEIYDSLSVEHFLRGLSDQTLAYEILIKSPWTYRKL